jgi:hypothetical protein
MDQIAWEFAKYAAELYFDGHSLAEAVKKANKLMNKEATNKAKRLKGGII